MATGPRPGHPGVGQAPGKRPGAGAPLPATPGALALLPARTLARAAFETEEARVLFSGSAVHAITPPAQPLTASFGLLFGSEWTRSLAEKELGVRTC